MNGRLYRYLKNGKYEPLKIEDYIFLSESEFIRITKILNLVWYSTDKIIINNNFISPKTILIKEGINLENE